MTIQYLKKLIFDPPQSSRIMCCYSCGTFSVYSAPKVPEERDTIHIDLRGFENKKPTKPEGFDSVRRILQISHDATSE